MNTIIPAQNKFQSAIPPSASACSPKPRDTLNTGLPPKPATFGAVHYSKKTDEWPTPKWLFQALDREFRFTLDPCSTDQNAKCAKHFTRKENGLIQPWHEES
ncbi:MAG: DNA N-6-adenine-methyltransferase, partial [Bryobacteraceae bacterium]